MRGGRRVGAGRPRKPKAPKLSWPPHDAKMLPVDYMLAVMRNPEVEARRRDSMAVAAAPFFHQKLASKDPMQLQLPLGEPAEEPDEASAALAAAKQGWAGLVN